MKKTIIFLALIILIVLLLVTYLNRLATVKVMPPENSEMQSGQAEPQAVPVELGQQRAATLVIKPATGSAKPIPDALEEDNKLKNERITKNTSVDSVQNSAEASSGQPNEAESGVKKINKYPTQKEVEEMNSRGIIMY